MLAALGAAIGLGNIWRFAYVAGENGGGAFIFVYLAAVALIGLPMLIAELAVGQAARTDAVGAYAVLSGAARWRWIGWLGVASGCAILAYYPVVAGWVVRYLAAYAFGGHPAGTGANVAAGFDAFIRDPLQPILWLAVVLAVSGTIVAAGIERGIEAASKLLMPLFAVLVVLLAGYGLSLPGAPRAFEFLFVPDWGALLAPRTYLAAVGQAFFSIGLAMGIFVTYGAYLPPGRRLPRAALVIAAGDTAIAIVAGLMIFPAVFTYGHDPAQGATLAFVVLPEVFGAMPGGRWVAAAFFLLLAVAAVTSVAALVEVPVSLVIARLGWRRLPATFTVVAAAFMLGVPIALGYGPARKLLPWSVPLLDAIDHLTSNIALPLSGIGIALFVGWVWPWPRATGASGFATPSLAQAWLWLLRLAIPAAIVLIIVRGLGIV
jgi:NSS family neurotransmitter:Na+ symporter